MMNNEAVVSVSQLVKRFGNFIAVDGISFTIPRGEIFGFLGSNGAGKSTTIRMLCGLLTPTSGSGTVAGFDILRESERIKERIGYMSQKFSLYEDLTVAENIEFYGDIYLVPKDRLAQRKAWVLEMADLTQRASSITGELSAGWKQRLALGCAMLHEPEILFLDEPTGGVDPASRRNFWELIYTVAGEGVTVFVTTHYMDEAEHCDRIALIDAGKLAALGSPQELKERYTAGLLLEFQVEPIIIALEILAKAPAVREAALFGTVLHVVTEDADAIEPLRSLLQHNGVKVAAIEKIVPSLEDVFVALIEQGLRERGER